MWTLDDVIAVGVHDLTRNAVHPRTGKPLDVERMIENRIASWLDYGTTSRRSGSRAARMTAALTSPTMRAPAPT